MTATDLTSLVRRADVCAAAVADCFRGDGEILANPIGTIPMIGGRLARELDDALVARRRLAALRAPP